MQHEDNVQYSHTFNLKTSKRYYQVSIDGWGSIVTFAIRLKMKRDDLCKLLEEQFNAFIHGYTLNFSSLKDFDRFKEWYLATRSVANLLGNNFDDELNKDD